MLQATPDGAVRTLSSAYSQKTHVPLMGASLEAVRAVEARTCMLLLASLPTRHMLLPPPPTLTICATLVHVQGALPLDGYGGHSTAYDAHASPHTRGSPGAAVGVVCASNSMLPAAVCSTLAALEAVLIPRMFTCVAHATGHA